MYWWSHVLLCSHKNVLRGHSIGREDKTLELEMWILVLLLRQYVSLCSKSTRGFHRPKSAREGEGQWSMSGLRLFLPTPELLCHLIPVALQERTLLWAEQRAPCNCPAIPTSYIKAAEGRVEREGLNQCPNQMSDICTLCHASSQPGRSGQTGSRKQAGPQEPAVKCKEGLQLKNRKGGRNSSCAPLQSWTAFTKPLCECSGFSADLNSIELTIQCNHLHHCYLL